MIINNNAYGETTLKIEELTQATINLTEKLVLTLLNHMYD